MNKNIKLYGDKEFAQRFRTLMSNRELRLEDIAKQTGNALSTVSTWRRGRLPKKPKTLESLARILNVSVEYLRTGQKRNAEIIFENELSDEILSDTDCAAKTEILSHIGMLINAAERQNGGLERLFLEIVSKMPLTAWQCAETRRNKVMPEPRALKQKTAAIRSERF